MAEQDDGISTCTLYCIMAAMLIFGTCNTIVMKAQNQTTCEDWCNVDQTPDIDNGDIPCADGPGTFYQAPLFYHPFF